MNAKKLLISIVSILVIPFAIDEIIFRNFYLDFVEPSSTAGQVQSVLKFQNDSYVDGMKNILIIGDSRVNEAFSPRIANEVGHKYGYHFVRLSSWGSTPRMWFYFLRKVDPQRNRFHSIYLMINPLYTDSFTNRSLDTQYLTPLLDLRDIYSYPQTFSDSKERERARMAVAFPAIPLRPDLIEFIKNPLARVHNVAVTSNGYAHWQETYEGSPRRLPDADMGSLKRVISALDDKLKDQISSYVEDIQKEMLNSHSISKDESFAYRSLWYGGIVDRYAGTSVSVCVFPVPRGPYQSLLGDKSDTTKPFKSLERKGLVIVPPAMSMHLEKPEYFFDSMHMNATGRVVFSKNLAETIIQQQN